MVGGDSMRPGLQLVGARFSNLLTYMKPITTDQSSPTLIFHDIQMAIFRYSVLRDATARCILNMLEHCGTHTERVTSNAWEKFK